MIIENGQIKKTDERYRTHYSMYEIRAGATTRAERYESNGFNPLLKTMRKSIRDVQHSAHNACVGELMNEEPRSLDFKNLKFVSCSLVDVEGKIVLDRGISTSTSETTRAEIRRRSLRIEDETGAINITI